MDSELLYYSSLLFVPMLFGYLLGHIPGMIDRHRLKKWAKLKEAENVLVKDQRGRQLYVHQSHILMAGFHESTECINCGGNSKTSEDLKKLIVPCSMELSVYDGNNKFKPSTGEPRV